MTIWGLYGDILAAKSHALSECLFGREAATMAVHRYRNGRLGYGASTYVACN